MGESCEAGAVSRSVQAEGLFKEEGVFVPQGGVEKMTNALMWFAEASRL